MPCLQGESRNCARKRLQGFLVWVVCRAWTAPNRVVVHSMHRRNGMILSEGAAVLILEAEEHARKRGAAILARVLGYASAFDPSADYNWNHEGQGLQKAITDALKESSLACRRH